jgi:hypothetical protein
MLICIVSNHNRRMRGATPQVAIESIRNYVRADKHTILMTEFTVRHWATI